MKGIMMIIKFYVNSVWYHVKIASLYTNAKIAILVQCKHKIIIVYVLVIIILIQLN